MSRIPTLECKPDGPYLVDGLEDLRDSRGERIPVDAKIALCRCGGSSKKPFCDGTHRNNGFSGAKLREDGAAKVDAYRGREITIHDNRALCAHAGICTDRLATVFKYGEEPWIDPDGATGAAIIETVRACPSGALSYSVGASVPAQAQQAPSITVLKDGPYAITGGVRLTNAPLEDGASADRFTLCRCGSSKNKPFCDGSHWDAGFKDERN